MPISIQTQFHKNYFIHFFFDLKSLLLEFFLIEILNKQLYFTKQTTNYLNQDKLKQHSREEQFIKTTNVDEV